jgi:hypothetical protein
MKVGDMVGYVNGDGPTGLVLASWPETHPEDEDVVETWCEILWDDGVISEDEVCGLEKINEYR